MCAMKASACTSLTSPNNVQYVMCLPFLLRPINAYTARTIRSCSCRGRPISCMMIRNSLTATCGTYAERFQRCAVRVEPFRTHHALLDTGVTSETRNTRTQQVCATIVVTQVRKFAFLGNVKGLSNVHDDVRTLDFEMLTMIPQHKYYSSSLVLQHERTIREASKNRLLRPAGTAEHPPLTITSNPPSSRNELGKRLQEKQSPLCNPDARQPARQL